MPVASIVFAVPAAVAAIAYNYVDLVGLVLLRPGFFYGWPFTWTFLGTVKWDPRRGLR